MFSEFPTYRLMSRNAQSSKRCGRVLGFRARHQYNGAQPTLVYSRDDIQKETTLSATPSKEGPDEINQEQFEQLLSWLDPDREKAGAKYESIRKRLIKLFVCSGCNVAEDLADKTINRVARKLPEFRATYVGEPGHYFYGVAKHIRLEWSRKRRPPAVLPPAAAPPKRTKTKNATTGVYKNAWPHSLQADHDLVLGYYAEEKHAKIDHRKKLAEQLGVGMNALRHEALSDPCSFTEMCG